MTCRIALILLWCGFLAGLGCQASQHASQQEESARSTRQESSGKSAQVDQQAKGNAGSTKETSKEMPKAIDPALLEGGGPPPRPWSVGVVQVALSPDGKLALFGYSAQAQQGQTFNAWVTLWDVERGMPIRALEGFAEPPAFLGFMPDGKTALACDESGAAAGDSAGPPFGPPGQRFPTPFPV
jgi:hypothetical protein